MKISDLHDYKITLKGMLFSEDVEIEDIKEIYQSGNDVRFVLKNGVEYYADDGLGGEQLTYPDEFELNKTGIESYYPTIILTKKP